MNEEALARVPEPILVPERNGQPRPAWPAIAGGAASGSPGPAASAGVALRHPLQGVAEEVPGAGAEQPHAEAGALVLHAVLLAERVEPSLQRAQLPHDALDGRCEACVV